MSSHASRLGTASSLRGWPQAGLATVLAVVLLLFPSCASNPAGSGASPPSGLTAEGRRRLDGCVQAMGEIRTALEAYHQRTGRFPERLEEATAASGGKNTPTCPASGQGYAAGYQRAQDGASWNVRCVGNHHRDAGVPADHPRYDSSRGLSVPVALNREVPAASASREPIDPDLDLCLTHLKSLGAAVQLYGADNEGHLPRRLSQMVPLVMKSMPTCPTAKRDTYSDGYTVAQVGTIYTIACTGGHPAGAAKSPIYPRFSSLTGAQAKP